MHGENKFSLKVTSAVMRCLSNEALTRTCCDGFAKPFAQNLSLDNNLRHRNAIIITAFY